jgi:hypothetical protein
MAATAFQRFLDAVSDPEEDDDTDDGDDGPCNHGTFNGNHKRIALLYARFGHVDLWTGLPLPADVRAEFREIKSNRHGGYAT